MRQPIDPGERIGPGLSRISALTPSEVPRANTSATRCRVRSAIRPGLPRVRNPRFDVVLWMSGEIILEIYVAGSNQSAKYFRERGDVDTLATILILEENDVRVEMLCSEEGVVATVVGSLTRPRDLMYACNKVIRESRPSLCTLSSAWKPSG
jgi:hypothetical protein